MFAVLQNNARCCGARIGSLLQQLKATSAMQGDRLFHAIPSLSIWANSNNQFNKTALLPTNQSFQSVQSRGLKRVDAVHRRCRHCYLMMINGIIHNICTVHPRHNQKKKTIRAKHTWLMTFAHQSKKRSW